MGLFGKKKDDNGDGTATKEKKADNGFQPDHRKARAWLDRAHTLSDSQNYDYAIDCYVSGLRFDPENMKEHEALFEVAARRMVSGGKPAGFKEKMGGGKTPIEKLMHAEKIWAKDLRNIAAARAVMERAFEIHQAEEALDLGEFIVWIGGKVMELNRGAGKKASKDVYIKCRDIFQQIEAFTPAVEACRQALQLSTDDGELLNDLKNLEAEKSIADSKMTGQAGASFESTKGGKEDDEDRRESLTDEQRARVIVRRRKQFEENPDDLDVRMALVRELMKTGDEENEEEAIKLLEAARKATGQYRFKVEIGDIRIKQYQRNVRMLKQYLESNPEDESTKKDLAKLQKEQLEFEIKEFEERVENYPTDMRVRFDYGRRLLQAKRYEDAVEAFQDAQSDPKLKVAAKELLGACYIHMDWIDPAIDTLSEAIEAHPFKDDKLGMSLRYLLMEALEKSARTHNDPAQARKALATASEVLQISIRYRDIRERVNKLKELVNELQQKEAG